MALITSGCLPLRPGARELSERAARTRDGPGGQVFLAALALARGQVFLAALAVLFVLVVLGVLSVLGVLVLEAR